MSRVLAGGLVLAIVSTLAVGAFAPTAWQITLCHAGPGCPLKLLTGIDCPFCGMTRATLALGRGELAHALQLHPLAPLVLAGLVAVLGMVIAGASLRGRRAYAVLAATGALWLVRLACA